jgi:Ca2+-binding EF-hand superfamily protein
LKVLKADLKRRVDWTLNRAFASIDVARDGFITFSSLLNFCRLNGYNPSENEVIAMVRRLDVDADQRINFDEFRLTFDEDGQPLG